jgi:NADH-quinone oxidoreductase subunit K
MISADHISLGHLLALSGILFALSVAGIFLNRKNVILLLMCVELLLLAANFNFVAFSRYLGDISGQVFVFFVLTVAAAESVRVFRADRSRGGVRHRSCDPRRAVPRAPEHQRRRPEYDERLTRA